MRNIVIFTDKDSSKLEAMIANSGDYDVRTKNIDELKDAMTFNPAVIVINCAEQKLKEAAMVTKLPLRP